MRSQNSLFVRATIAFLALPALVAGVVPGWIVQFGGPDSRYALPGLTLIGIGGFFLLWCVRDFFKSGKGTLAPWDPPRHLVVVGLYRFVRNPMYLAVLTVVLGWSILYLSFSLLGYALILAAGFHVRVILFEEPWLQRQFGAEWDAYSASTSRWLPRPTRKAK
jgi:protein-S-isoprenylcysteine O-methyltransferase Ste14